MYEPGKRAWLKIRHKRTVDVLLAGFRWHKNGVGTAIGSFLPVFTTTKESPSTSASARASPRSAAWDSLVDRRPRLPGMAAFSRRGASPATSRWRRDKTLEWEPLRVERALEVSFDHMQGSRFRNTAHFVRWRPDKPLAECTYAQLTPPYELAQVFAADS